MSALLDALTDAYNTWCEDLDDNKKPWPFIAKELEENYIFLLKAELPGTRVVEDDYGTYIELDDDDSRGWSVLRSSSDFARKTGLAYLAAAEALDAYRAKDAVKGRRLDELAQEFCGVIYANDLGQNTQAMLKRIAELEEAAN